MFKLYLEVRRRGEMAMDVPQDSTPPTAQANPTLSVPIQSGDQGLGVPERLLDGQAWTEDDRNPQTGGSLQTPGQTTTVQTLAPSLLAPAQQDQVHVSVAQFPPVAQQATPAQTQTLSTQNVAGQRRTIPAPQQQADSRQVRLEPAPTVQLELLPSAILAPQQQPGPLPVHLGPTCVPVASSPLQAEIPSDVSAAAMAAPAPIPVPAPVPAPLPSPAIDPYVAILEKQGQILEKLADTSRATAVKPVVPKPPEQYKLKADIRSWLSQFDTYLSLTRVEDSNKAQYLLTNLSSEAYEQVSKAQWPSDTLSDYAKLKDALKLKFGPSENQMIYRSQFAVAERAGGESAVNFLDRLRDLLKRGYPDCDLKGLEPLLVNQFTRGLKLPKASEALILEPPSDSAVALKIAQKNHFLFS